MGCNSDNNSAILGNCFNQTEYVKDQLCTQFSIAPPVPPATDPDTVIIYEAINESVVASFVLRNTGPIPLTVTITNAAGTDITGTDPTIGAGQSLLRTVDSLGTISITGPASTETSPAKGELDIVVRYTLN
ncbi:hypothetical protein C2I27_05205 [Priestia megaterium]|uniref:S-Ena type endospore appendage n=1 Tax=Priestia TaxID=2800373 RepID=UPI000D50CC9F|nr:MULTISPECIES: S-Ena type endospore appendage [Priestia]MED3885662.1 hypothetical protein [Priestia aryabhattai]MED4259639.1 hypothetical protein [Priestia aryabhattai]PVC73900.1 hypothetical protein C2I27_05205 [Priestia megaterium]